MKVPIVNVCETEIPQILQHLQLFTQKISKAWGFFSVTVIQVSK